jgi:hypothetical protein
MTYSVRKELLRYQQPFITAKRTWFLGRHLNPVSLSAQGDHLYIPGSYRYIPVPSSIYVTTLIMVPRPPQSSVGEVWSEEYQEVAGSSLTDGARKALWDCLDGKYAE